VSPFEWTQTVGVIAQVFIAVIAVWYAARSTISHHHTAESTRQFAVATKESVFVESTVRSLMDVVARARAVRAAYRGMFTKFQSVKEKGATRVQWLKQRDEAGTILAELVELLPAIAPAFQAWKELEKEEDTYATGDALKLPTPKEINAAHARYEAEHLKFIKVAGEIMTKMH
jgi:hypothetical protein